MSDKKTTHNILVRDFTGKQKSDVEKAADGEGKSTSRFIRDSAIKAAGGKVEEEPVKAKANGAATKAKKKGKRE